MDALHLDYPFAGSRMLQRLLKAEGLATGRLHVATLMKRMGIEAIYCRPDTTKPAPGHKIYPYLLRNLPIVRSNQVWATDISRRMRSIRPELHSDGQRLCPSGGGGGLVHLARSVVAAVDHAWCGVLQRGGRGGHRQIWQARNLSAMHLHCRDNTDQGSQFTGAEFTGMPAGHGIKISMDGKGAWRDNVFVERLWRSVKYEEVYLHAYASVPEARAGLGRHPSFYNSKRPRSSLDGRTPDKACLDHVPMKAAA